jgi:hypothetical protein
MNWLKRNLLLVAGGAIALALLGLAGYYLFVQRGREAEVTARLESQIADWKRLTTRNPSANETNIVAARAEQKRLSDLLDTTMRFFVPAGTYTNIDSATFKTLLETTLFDLEQLAGRQGVALPQKYSFTTKWLRESVVFDQAELLPLAHQLAEIRALCEILFEARIHSLVRLRRIPVSKRDSGSTDYLAGKKPSTNAVTGAVVMPYEVTFQGFTPELAAVLTGLQRSPHCFMVKMMDVDRAGSAPLPMADAASGGAPDPMARYGAPGGAVPGRPQSSDDILRDRYGLGRGGSRGGSSSSSEFRSRYGSTGPGGRYAPPSAPVAPGAPAPGTPGRRGPQTVLEEELLKITMTVEAVRLPPTSP